MARLKLEKVTGVVALSYLVIIPLVLVIVSKKLEALDADIDVLWDESTVASKARVPFGGLRKWVGR